MTPTTQHAGKTLSFIIDCLPIPRLLDFIVEKYLKATGFLDSVFLFFSLSHFFSNGCRLRHIRAVGKDAFAALVVTIKGSGQQAIVAPVRIEWIKAQGPLGRPAYLPLPGVEIHV